MHLMPKRLLNSSEGELERMMEEIRAELARRERDGELEWQLVEKRKNSTEEPKKLGGYMWQMVRCKKDCQCNGGRGHGPYLYRHFRNPETGKMTSEYIPLKVAREMRNVPPRPAPEDAVQLKPLSEKSKVAS